MIPRMAKFVSMGGFVTFFAEMPVSPADRARVHKIVRAGDGIKNDESLPVSDISSCYQLYQVCYCIVSRET